MQNESLYIVEKSHVEIRPSAMPIRKSGEALLRILYGGICGSDLNTYRGTYAYAQYPNIPGHEFSAEILDIDPNTQGLEPGMLVTANPYFNCGVCYSCQRGFVNCCTTNETMGCHRTGAFSRFLTMPIERLYPGNGLNGKQLALVEPFCISYHGVKRANIKPNDRVLIMGAGTIGINAMFAAKLRGAIVCMADVLENKLDYAKKLGADSTILYQDAVSFEQEIMQWTNGQYCDVAIEAVGLPSTFQTCIDSVCHGGNICLIGISNHNLDFNFTTIQKKELNLYGSRNAVREDFLEVISLFQEGAVDPLSIVTNEYPFSQAAQALEDLHKDPGTRIKVLLDFTSKE